MNILVLGCGKIGSRHVQSLAESKHGLQLYAVDNSNASLEKVQKIFNNVPSKNMETNLIATKDISKIKDKIDIVIIASNSKERSKLIKSVINNFNPMHIILEKVLFNKISDYKKFEELFNQINTKVWVNQYMGYEFSFLSKYFGSNEKFKMKVSGNWGLCCNSVHFIEIFHHLCNRAPLNLKEYSFSDDYIKSKREGYYELFGTIKIASSLNSELILECEPSVPENVINIDATSDSHELKDVWVDEHHNCVIKNGNKSSSDRYYVRRQSERTLEIIESLIRNDYCKLPSYNYSSYHHLLILNLFKKKFNELGVDIKEGIPIT
tara:strand:- start:808 stop:1773 length:966 start_codon:yes stop_codon:yes gene_type:complete